MRNLLTSSFRLVILAFAAASLSAPLSGPAVADFDDPPKPKKIDCTKPENKNKPQCRKSYREMSDDEIYNAAYWLARHGEYKSALGVLAHAHDPNDKRILNATGYATRKLGDIDGALVYYARALDIDPGYTRARSYLGEAYLGKGDVTAAKAQLDEIESRCGRTCDGYAELAGHIAAFEGLGRRDG